MLKKYYRKIGEKNDNDLDADVAQRKATINTTFQLLDIYRYRLHIFLYFFLLTRIFKKNTKHIIRTILPNGY